VINPEFERLIMSVRDMTNKSKLK